MRNVFRPLLSVPALKGTPAGVNLHLLLNGTSFTVLLHGGDRAFPEVEGVAQILEFPVIVEGCGTLSAKLQFFEKLNFVGFGAGVKGIIFEEFAEPRFFSRGVFGIGLHELKLFGIAQDQTLVQDDFDGKGGEVDIQESISGSRKEMQFSTEISKMSASRKASMATLISS